MGFAPITRIIYTTTLQKWLDGVPRCLGAVVWVVSPDAVIQAFSHIITQLLFIHEEQDGQGHLSKEDNQQQDKERHKQALVLLDGAHAAEECNHHDNGAHDDERIAQCEGGEIMEKHPEVVVDQEVDTKAQNAAATEPKEQVEEKQDILQQFQATHAHVGTVLPFCKHFSSVV